MEIDKFGRVIIDTDQAFDLLYKGKIKSLSEIFFVDDELVRQYNTSKKRNADDIPTLQIVPDEGSIEEFDKEKQNTWFMPEEYYDMDIEGYLVNVCPKENYQRLIEELRLFKKYNMMDLLRYLKYLVDVMRENNVVWGVGRGSSVASYTLFLLGIHKIDSIKYKLDMNEFLKENEHGI
jgi:DNA polymerase III alpha subunit